MENKTKVAISAVVVVAIAILLWILLSNKEYEVTFDTAGGSIVETQYVKKGEFAQVPLKPVREGYVFYNWYLNGEVFDFNTPIKENITLIAQWGIKTDTDNKKLTIVFDLGDGKLTSVDVLPNGTIKEPEAPVREGYKFLYWEYEGEEFNFEDKVTKDLTLVAKWEEIKENKPNYKPNKPNKPNKPKDVMVSEVKLSVNEITIDKKSTKQLEATVLPNNATNKNVTWKSENEKIAVVDKNGLVTGLSAGTTKIIVTAGGKTSVCTITVKALPTYKVTFAKGDGDVQLDAVMVEKGELLTKPVVNPTKEYYDFDKWLLDNKEYDFNSPVIKDIILEPVFKPACKYTAITDEKGYQKKVTIKCNGKDITSKVINVMDANNVNLGFYSKVYKYIPVKDSEVDKIAKAKIGNKVIDIVRE